MAVIVSDAWMAEICNVLVLFIVLTAAIVVSAFTWFNRGRFMEFNPEAEWPIKQKQKKWPFKDMAMWQTISFDVGCTEWRKIQNYAHCYANDNHKKVRTYYDQARKVGYVQRIG